MKNSETAKKKKTVRPCKNASTLQTQVVWQGNSNPENEEFLEAWEEVESKVTVDITLAGATGLASVVDSFVDSLVTGLWGIARAVKYRFTLTEQETT